MPERWRREIAECDREIVSLLSRRAALALCIAREKTKHGIPIYSPAQEDQVIQRARELNLGPLSDAALERVFHLIVAETRHLEEEVVGSDRGDASQCSPNPGR